MSQVRKRPEAKESYTAADRAYGAARRTVAHMAAVDFLKRAGRAGAAVVRHPGHERNLVLLVLKSALAATVSWWLAKEVLDFESPAFAPFSALLAVNTTVDTSIRQALRYTAAVTVGVTVQAVAGFLLGPGLSVFLVVAVVALAIGQWKGLGEQSAQVPTAAFFAFSAFTSASTTVTRATMLGEIVALVLVGCGIGLVVNVCLAPPLRYRSAEQGLRSFACEIRGLLRAVAEGLEAGEYAPERTREWRAGGERAHRAAVQARAALETGDASLRRNPRRLLPSHRRITGFHRYRQVLSAMDRVVYQLNSLIRSLEQWRETENTYSSAPLLTAYSVYLATLADAVDVLTELDLDRIPERTRRLREADEVEERALEEVLGQADRQELPLTDPHRPFGVLVVEATRLLEELRYVADALDAAEQQGVAERERESLAA